MAIVAGVQGSVTFASGYVTATRSWTINIEADDLDVTSWDDYDGAAGDLSEWDTYIGGRKRWGGSFTCYIDSGASEDLIPDGIPLGEDSAAASATFVVSAGVTWGGDIIITGIESSQTVDGVAEVTYSFRGTGACAYTPAS